VSLVTHEGDRPGIVRLRLGGKTRAAHYPDMVSPYSVAGGPLVGAPRYAEVTARITRARALYAELGNSLTAFFETCEPTCAMRHDPSSGMSTLVLQVPGLPIENSLVVSDIAHHLRSALDNLLFILLAGDTLSATVQRNIQFPIVTSVRRFPNGDDRRHMPGASAELVDAVCAVQPCIADTEEARRLALLDEVNRLDKHRFLHFGVTHAINELSPKRVHVTPRGTYSRHQLLKVFNEGAEGPAIDVAAVIVEPPTTPFDLSIGSDELFDFTAVFGYARRFFYTEVEAMVDVVDNVCEGLWSAFGTEF